ncbi:MAG: Na(+)-translocating NADH-quinone reductase subunit A [Gammaproteobacteria bacterium]
MQIRLKRGLDLPLDGGPEQVIHEAPRVPRVAVMGRSFVGLKPAMQVEEGDRVRLGQPLLSDKNNPRVSIVAPGGGTIKAIHRGARRVLQSIIIDLDEDEESREFKLWPRDRLTSLARDDVIEQLLDAGLWTALRTRPYSKIAGPDTTPSAIFVNAMDTNPLAPDPEVVIAGAQQDFLDGLDVVSRLPEGPVYVCCAPTARVPVPERDGFTRAEFAGPHPAGLVGTHIHFLHPVGARRQVWHLNYQDVIAIGRLFTTGQLNTERVIALAGPPVLKPRLLRTRMGAHVGTLLDGELEDVVVRPLSGSVLSGYRASGWAGYLGRYHLQISVIREAEGREFLGWIRPGPKKFSVTNVFISSLWRGRKMDLDTSQNGSPRAMVPIGSYERVMPLDILPTQLLRAILVRDTDSAQKLGALELDEEDLALCTFVCPGKHDFGPLLRESLEQIEKEG